MQSPEQSLSLPSAQVVNTPIRFFACLAILIAGCSTTIGDSVEGATDARTIDYRNPPEQKEGSGTSPGCEGATARGDCQQGSAVSCDLDRGRLLRIDCEALGEQCVLDVSRGALCKSLEEDTGPGSGAASPCADTGISEKGFCTTTGEAIYCDNTQAAAVTRTWDCEAAGKTCAVDECAQGAFCCGGGAPPAGDLCAESGLDFTGVCEGDVAKWCSESVGPREKNCSALGQRCEEDTCATGAYCCGDIETGGTLTPEAECAALGFEGICSDDLTIRYCFADEIEEAVCSGTRTCQVDACINGAGCCEPSSSPMTECQTVGSDGICENETTLKYCFDENVGIEIESCGTDTVCEVLDGFADCVDLNDPCAGLGPEGICIDANTLHYCVSGEFTVVDCAATGKRCQDATESCLPGYAECCD